MKNTYSFLNRLREKLEKENDDLRKASNINAKEGARLARIWDAHRKNWERFFTLQRKAKIND